MKHVFLVTLSIFTFCLLFIELLIPHQALASINQKEVDISLEPTEVLILASNLKPGDSIIKHLKIRNAGSMDFHYSSSVQKDSGSDLFYRQLQLEASIDGNMIYEGPLHQFSGMKARHIKSSSSEDMKLRILFPWESGNEFQGLSAIAIIQFIAEEDIETTPTEEIDEEGVTSEDRGKPTLSILESSLPQTGETPPTLYYLIGGFLLMTGLGFYTTTVIRKRRG